MSADLCFSLVAILAIGLPFPYFPDSKSKVNVMYRKYRD